MSHVVGSADPTSNILDDAVRHGELCTVDGEPGEVTEEEDYDDAD